MTEQTADDGELISRARQGDKRAFGMLVQKYWRRVYSVCLSVCRNEADAEDCAQDSLLKAWTNLDNYEHTARFAGWLSTIAYRTALSSLKSKASSQERDRRYYKHHRGVSKKDSQALQSVFAKERDDILRSCIDELPEVLKECFLAKQYSKYSYKEIVEVLGYTENQARGAVERAKRKLKECLERRGLGNTRDSERGYGDD